MKKDQIWKLTALFVAGMAVGLVGLNFYMWPRPSSASPDLQESRDAAIVFDSSKRIEVIPADDNVFRAGDNENLQVEDTFERGDKFFIVGNYSAALNSYRKYMKATQRRDARLLLRTAMCLEQESELKFSVTHYQAAAAQAANENQQAIALAGLARVFILQQRNSEAIDLLSSHAHKIVLTGRLPELTRAQLSLQWARALQSQVIAEANKGKPQKLSQSVNYLTDSSTDLSLPTTLAEIGTALAPDEFLSSIDQAPSEIVPELSGPRLKIKVIQRPSDSAESISLSVSTDLQPILAIFSQTSSALKLDFQMSKGAIDILSERSKVIEFEAITLGVLMDRLLIPFGLIWHQRDGVIQVQSKSETTQTAISDFSFDATSRAFRRHELEFPENRFRAAAIMSRARLSIMRNELAVANNLYQELGQLSPRGELQAKLFFNRAKLAIMQSRTDPAISLLYQAVDQTLDPNLEASAYCMLSGLHLSRGETGEATKTAGRALATAVTVRQKSIAAINQARAYLFERNPISANDALFRNKEYIEADGESVAAASLLGAYAHSMGLSKKHKHSNQTAIVRMVNAASKLAQADQARSFADYYFASLAYSKLGRHDLAIEMMTKSIAQPDLGAWQRVATYELGVLLQDSNRPEEAMTALTGLTNVNDVWRIRALLKIANIQSSKNQNSECIGNCQLILASSPTDLQKQQALEILGNAYQSQGKHHIAALCFAGMLPAEY
jgi:tetratricopeptide (TPR) repeat protein